jgi:D-2-hydroxyglutarate dehydrogenase
VDNLSTLRKDNTGYDVKQLLIGAEGTLGVVTKVAILAARKPKCQSVALLGCASYTHVLQAMQKARADLQEIVSAVEFLDRGAMDLVLKHLPGARDPLPSVHPFYMLIETSGSDEGHDSEKLSGFLEQALENNLILDGTVAQDHAQARSLWKLREGIAEALAKDGPAVYKYDVSLPVAGMYDLVEQIQQRLKQAIAEGDAKGVVGYGHLGDGNLHLNVSAARFTPRVLALLEPYIFEQTSAVRGSVSAEHGLGLAKAQYIAMSKSKEMIELMRQIKTVFDPQGILNPYKVLPPVEESAKQ